MSFSLFILIMFSIWQNYFTSSDDKIAGVILKELPELEIYNSNFTSNFGEWALGFCAGIYEKDNPASSDHADSPLQSVSTLDISNRNIHNLINKVELFLILMFYLLYASFFIAMFQKYWLETWIYYFTEWKLITWAKKSGNSVCLLESLLRRWY